MLSKCVQSTVSLSCQIYCSVIYSYSLLHCYGSHLSRRSFDDVSPSFGAFVSFFEGQNLFVNSSVPVVTPGGSPSSYYPFLPFLFFFSRKAPFLGGVFLPSRPWGRSLKASFRCLGGFHVVLSPHLGCWDEGHSCRRLSPSGGGRDRFPHRYALHSGTGRKVPART